MKSSSSLRLVSLSVCLLLGVACRDPAPPSPPVARAAPPRVSSEPQGTPFDLGEVVRRAHFAYRPDGDGWSAGDGTWSARATASGLTFTPRHALEPASSERPSGRRARLESTPRVLSGTPVTFGSPVLSRGGSRLELAAARGTVTPEGALAWARGEVEEQLHNSEDGVEQRLRFTRVPRGEGALRLRVPVRGLPLAGETPGGVHFADATGLGVRYGGASWTDASGKRTELRASAVEGAVELQVPVELLASASFPATLAMGVSPEFGLDTPVTHPGAGNQSEPAIASNGTDYLVVWQDTRNGPNTDIYGTRVTASGTVLDPLGFIISTELNSQSNPAVAFDGTKYFVVWDDSRASGVHIYGARVSPSGAVLDPTGVEVATSTAFNQRMSNPAVAFDGTNYLVAWSEAAGFWGIADLYARLVSTSGVALDSPIPVSLDDGEQIRPAVAFDGTNYLVVWEDTRQGFAYDVYAARISTTGAVLDPAGIALSPSTHFQEAPTVAFNGTDFLVAWGDYRTIPGDIYATRVSPSGAVLDPAGLRLTEAAEDEGNPHLIRQGTGYLLTWNDYRSGNSDIYAARVSGAGTVLDGQGLAVLVAPGDQRYPVVASNGTGTFVAWYDTRTTDVIGARMDLAGTVLDPGGFLLSPAPNSEQNAAVAFDGTNYLVVWQDNRGAALDLYGIRVSANGTVLDPSAFVISNASGNQQMPTVAFDGTNYLVAWEDSRVDLYDIYGARVSPAGTVLDPNGFLICNRTSWQQRPQVASDGTNSLVVWASSDATYTLIGTRVSKAGVVLDPGFITISSGPLGILDYSLAFDGTNYMAVWTDSRGTMSSEIYGARVNRAGAVLDPTGIPITNEPFQQSQPNLAFDGTNYLVVYVDILNGADLVARRVSRSGAVLDATAIPISVLPNTQQMASVTYDGTDFLIVWQHLLNISSRDLYGGRVTSAGVPRDGNGFPISVGPMDDSLPIVVTSSPGNSLVVYQSRDPALGTGIHRMKARRISQTSNPPSANAGSVTTPEDVPATVVLSGSDADNDPLSYTIATAPAHGTLSGTAPNLTYTPAPHYHGPDSFTFTVSDGQTTSAPATVSVTVTPVEDAPAASAQAIQTQEDTAAEVTLTGTDADGDAVSFTVASGPSHGTLTGTPPHLTYTPAPDYQGPDSFTFTVSDGQSTSAPATVSITVMPGNDAPTASAQSLTTAEDVALPLVLSGSDMDGDPLFFAIASPPANGTLSGTPPHLTYTPALDYHGPDSFAFTVSDGQVTSAPATVSLSVTPRNDAPVALSGVLSLVEDVATPVILSGSDVDGDPISFTVASPPTHGTLTGTAPNLTYTPAPDYHGPDSFTFTVSDGQATSTPATVSVSISASNDAPVATARSLTLDEDTTAAVTLTGTDVEGDRLSFTVASPPAHGTLTGTAPNFTYRPAADYHGPDSFTFMVSDGQATSAPATVSLSVTPSNDAPVASPLTVSTDEDTPVLLTLSGTDVDGDTLSFTVASSPSHGTLTGTAPDLTYTPEPGYHGPDSFTFTVSDGQASSAPATVSLTVAAVNDAPVATAQVLTTPEDTAATLTLAGSDAEGSRLTFALATPPSHGMLTGTAPNLTYTPEPDVHGSDSFTFTVSDGQATSAPATVTISVSAVNDAPVALADSLTPLEDTPTPVVLSGQDADGDALSYTVASSPSHGTLSGAAPNLTYTPAPDYQGPDSFTFTVSDGQATSAPATVSLSVLPGNDAPVAEPLALTVPAGHPTPLFLSGQDKDGDELTFAIVTGPEVGKLTGTPPDVLYTAPPSFRGSTRFTFSVSDGTVSSQAEVQLTVVKKGLLVSAAVDSRRPAERQPVRFYANAVDEGGAPISLTWDFGDGQSSQEELPVHTFAAPGIYDVRLKATTATEEATTSLRLRVRSFAPITVDPNALFSPSLIAEEGTSLTFRVDAAQPSLTYSWDFGDGSPATTGATASHEWDDDGRFTVKVTASDGSGARWVATRSLTILNAPPVPLPQAALSVRTGEPASVQLAGSDPAGAKDPLQWELLSGEGTLSPDGRFSWTPAQAGLSTLVATVADGDGGEAPLAFQVAVDSPPVPEPEPSTGCGCGAGSGGASGALGLGLLLALLAFSRRVLG